MDPRGSFSMAQVSSGTRLIMALEDGLVSIIQRIRDEAHAIDLVCDWWHGVPQLFWKNIFYDTEVNVFPSSCASVNLVAVQV